MAAQVKAEWIKARSLRSTWIIVAIGILGIVVQALQGAISFSSDSPHVQSLNVLSGSIFTLIAVTILGVMLAASEYGSKSIISTYTLTGDRLRVVVAKAIVAAAIGIVLGVLSVPISRLVAAIWFAFGGDGSWDAGIGTALHYGYGITISFAGFAIVGVAIGVLCRSVGIGTAVAFVGIFILDSILGSVSFYSEYAFTAVASVLTDPDGSEGKLPAFGSSIALMVLYAVALTGIAWAVERHRDVG